MKYLILIYSNPASWVHPMFLHQDEALSEADRDVRMAEFAELLEEIETSGELVGSGALAAPATTQTVRVAAAGPQVTDGPFVEAKEQLAGFFLVDCESPERAVAIATRFPDARYSAVEVRPVMDPSGMEM